MKQKLSLDERTKQILSISRTLFAENGYAETTLDDIAKKAGISRPRIIQIFGSKKKIYTAIAENAYKAHPMDRDLQQPIKEKDDLKVFETFAYHILFHTRQKEDREVFRILLAARLKEDDFFKTHFLKKDTLMISRLIEYIAQGVEAGRFRKVDPQTVTYAYQAMISNLAMYKNVMKQMDFVSIEALSRESAQIFVRGIAAPENPVEEP